MAVTSTSALSLPLILLLLLPVYHACGPLNSKELKAACDKTPHPGYCFGLFKARYDGPMAYHIFWPYLMAQYLMPMAGDIGQELAALVRAEVERDDPPSARRICEERYAAVLDAAASKLGTVDGALLENSREAFDPVYRYVQSNAAALAENWKECPGYGDLMVSGHKRFAMLLDLILVLGKLPTPPCPDAPASSPSR